MKIEVFKNEEDARKNGKPIKIFDGFWFEGILWKESESQREPNIIYLGENTNK